MKGIGIELDWECSACGAIVQTQHPFWDEETRKKVKVPKSCISCGKGQLSLIHLKECTFSVVPRGGRVLDKEGETLFENEEEN